MHIKPLRGERERESLYLIPVTVITLHKYITIVNNNKRTTRAREGEEREGEETYLGHETGEPDLTFPGFSALFYTPCPRGHQRSQLSPIRSFMIRKLSIFNIGLFRKG